MSSSTRRLIDANSNRASEAARTLEDLARFVLDDGPLALRFKRIRHELGGVLLAAGLSKPVRSASRNTAEDAGVVNSAADSHARSNLVAVASAAGSRLTEALRVVEETLKLDTPSQAAGVEQLRYAAYDAERSLLRRLVMPAIDWPVCVLITESLCTHHNWLDVSRAAIGGGAACLQLREKDLADRELLERARRLVELARPQGVAVVINDRPDIALLAEADGVHVGQNDLAVSQARKIVGDRIVIGVSCSSFEQAKTAVESQADVIGIGAMYPTTTKAKPHTAGPALLSRVLADEQLSAVPHLAIGGIDAARASEFASIGCHGVAVSSTVCSASDPAAETGAIVAAIRGGHVRAEASQGAQS